MLHGAQHITSRELTNTYNHEQKYKSSLFQDIVFTRVSPLLPKNKGNYSHMKGINIISILWMEYKGMNEYKCKSTTRFGITTK
jgi:hypothetical protein